MRRRKRRVVSSGGRFLWERPGWRILDEPLTAREEPMKDFTDIAAFLRSCKELDGFLEEHQFREVEGLSPKLTHGPIKPTR
jgi:hypothetical protein